MLEFSNARMGAVDASPPRADPPKASIMTTASAPGVVAK